MTSPNSRAGESGNYWPTPNKNELRSILGCPRPARSKMIHSIIVGILSLAGLAVWARLTINFDPSGQEQVRSAWSSMPLLGQCWLVLSFIVPGVYYVFTFLCSISVIPKRLLKPLGFPLHIIAAPVFTVLYSDFPSVTKSAVLTAFFWFMLYRERVKDDAKTVR
jgi:hypothetical protein